MISTEDKKYEEILLISTANFILSTRVSVEIKFCLFNNACLENM